MARNCLCKPTVRGSMPIGAADTRNHFWLTGMDHNHITLCCVIIHPCPNFYWIMPLKSNCIVWFYLDVITYPYPKFRDLAILYKQNGHQNVFIIDRIMLVEMWMCVPKQASMAWICNFIQKGYTDSLVLCILVKWTIIIPDEHHLLRIVSSGPSH